MWLGGTPLSRGRETNCALVILALADVSSFHFMLHFAFWEEIGGEENKKKSGGTHFVRKSMECLACRLLDDMDGVDFFTG